ncbi:Electron transport complex subunit RsxG [Roseimaritima multifibrata]|uniref:Electron transport complex subunit RsxG n=1 Tax=Roseimaritima multifibrata TaxID=1930274 RepID=A0A517MNL3_9BACT|nr:FMN-binding protein [Roseimaritima multifibrata]QDS96478.1 Electron transport complex subunit RsxG [Roseimaritima multifibrata]
MSKPERALPVVNVPSGSTNHQAEGLPPARRRWRTVAVHGLRLFLLMLLVATLRYAQQRRYAQASQVQETAVAKPSAGALSAWFGKRAVCGPVSQDDANGAFRVVVDDQGEPLGKILQTMPMTENITGYRGPNNLLLGLDGENRIVGVELEKSWDTVDHVLAIQEEPAFFNQFLDADPTSSRQVVDVVSGATLTSLAIRDAVAVRRGESISVSARFPESLTLAEAEKFFPEASKLVPSEFSEAERTVLNREGERLGTLVRTGPYEDHLNGYQGPTELLLGLDPEGRLQQIVIRSSFDNQPYVSYMDDEPWYFDPLRNQTWEELAVLDVRELGMEGVSGATMTSMAAAETVIAAAENRLQQIEEQRATELRLAERTRVQWSAKSIASIVILVFGFGLSRSRLRGNRIVRLGWQVVVIVGFGLLTGNLLSIALVMGWSSGGIAWRLAPGLAAVYVVSLGLAAISKTPYYCAQICPHGAIQQRLPRRFKLPRFLKRFRGPYIAVSLLVAAYVVTLIGWETNLAAWEPFDAYLWWTGAGGGILLAVVTIVISLFEPMAYCRYGCPTGQLLTYLRPHRKSAEVTPGDAVVVAMLLGSWVWLLV